MEDLNKIIRHSNVRFVFPPKRKREIVSTLSGDEMPLSITRIQSVELPDGPVRGNHLYALVTTRRLILIFGDTLHIETRNYFHFIDRNEIASISEVEDRSITLHLSRSEICRIAGWNKWLGVLRQSLV